MYYSHYDSPLGQLLLVGDAQNIHRIDFPQNRRPVGGESDWELNDAVFDTLRSELEAYFEGKLKQFSVSVAPEGTAFQKSVWEELMNIEYGEKRTYAQIAKSIGKPTASRAVGSANGSNPISIVVPCHRVIGTNGTLTGYAGGLNTKHWLLSHEAGEQSLFPFDEW